MRRVKVGERLDAPVSDNHAAQEGIDPWVQQASIHRAVIYGIGLD